MKLKKLQIKSFVTTLTDSETLHLFAGKEPVLDTKLAPQCVQMANPATTGQEGDPHDLGGGFG